MTRHVPLSEFKDHASELFAAAAAGEEIIVTRHGRPTARVSAISTNAREQSKLDALARLAEIRHELRVRGMTASVEEMIEWKNEGRP